MKKFKLEFEMNDNFEKGDCFNCLFRQLEWFDDDGYTDYYDYCFIFNDSQDCPLQEVIQ